jgi:hypothetical protein
LQTFRPAVGQFANGGELGEINNPQHIDIDVASFMKLTKIKILEALKTSFGITLTSNASSLILSRNQVNVSTIAMT